MKVSRPCVFALLMALTFSSVSLANDKAGASAVPAPATFAQAKTPVILPAGDYELVSVIYEFAPGAGFPRHMHGGKVQVVVLSGEITLHEKGGTGS